MSNTSLIAELNKPRELQNDSIIHKNGLQNILRFNLFDPNSGNYEQVKFSGALRYFKPEIVNQLTTYETNKNYVLKMSTLKRRRNRQALLGFRGTWEESKAAAATLASGRCNLVIQDVKLQKTDTGSLYWFQPWMGATLAAGMQAAGFYRAIFGRGINCSGVIHADGTYNPEDDDQSEDGLKVGIMPMKERESGGYEFVSDQTTYSADSSFYFNSLQAVYVGDIMAMSLNARCERKFKGKSPADIGAASAQTFIEGILEEFRRNKFIAPSVGAPNGYKGLKVSLVGSALPVEVEVKLAGAIYFIPINLNVAQVEQSA